MTGLVDSKGMYIVFWIILVEFKTCRANEEFPHDSTCDMHLFWLNLMRIHMFPLHLLGKKRAPNSILVCNVKISADVEVFVTT